MTWYSPILDVAANVVLRTGIVFALYLLFAGHNAPGGGFIAGLVAGACLVLDHIALRSREGRGSLGRVTPRLLLGWGLAIAVGVGVAGLAWGGGFFDQTVVSVTLPMLGTMKLTSALGFDLGVFAVVVGLVAALLDSLGSGWDEELP
ncbi:MAG TPA: MnhB domain-containing protein [Acidimicrobiia bacterium]|nr:MnhB domain-containing protein [Acidimicrobiia bacterium]